MCAMSTGSTGNHGHHDCNDRDRVPEAKEALNRVLAESALEDTKLLVFANKQDLAGAMSAAELTEGLGLNELRGRSWYIQACCSTSGDGLYEGLDWLLHTPSSWKCVSSLPGTRKQH